jgi:hypothetical protein
VDEHQGRGEKEIVWDGRSTRGVQVASGIYYLQLNAGKFKETRKMVVLR